MKVTRAELKYIRNNLISTRAYRNTDIPHGVVLWYPWMQVFLDKVENHLHQSEHLKDDQVLT